MILPRRIDPAKTTERPPLIGRLVHVWGLPVHLHMRGQGAPVLLLHGNGSLGEEILSCFPEVPGICWIAPDRPGYGFSAPLPAGHRDPLTLAAWTADLMTALGIGQAAVVAHSIAAGAALCLAGGQPGRVSRLALLAPFCRPTPHRWMPALRLAVLPGVGRVMRGLVLPLLVALWHRRILARLLRPNGVPPWLAQFPLSHAARGQAVLTMAAELRAFNDGMDRAARHLRLTLPVSVLVGGRDCTARPDWHIPWLRARAERLDCVALRQAGHLVHHAAPAVALRLIAPAAA